MIPRLVYRHYVNKNGTLDGYLNFTLSEFRVADSPTLNSLAGDLSNITTCKWVKYNKNLNQYWILIVFHIYRYTDFRLPPSSPDKYTLSSMFYIILACRLGFVVVFEVSHLKKRFQCLQILLVGLNDKNTIDLSFQIYFYLLRPKHIFLDQGFKLNL